MWPIVPFRNILTSYMSQGVHSFTAWFARLRHGNQWWPSTSSLSTCTAVYPPQCPLPCAARSPTPLSLRTSHTSLGFFFLAHLPTAPFPLFTLSSNRIYVFYHNSDPQKGILTRYQNKNLYLIWEQLHSEVGCAGLLSAQRVFFIKQVIRRWWM